MVNSLTNQNLTTLTSTKGNKTINLSYYKHLGLYIKFEDLGSFKNGSMVEAFNDACKAIYDQDMADEKYDRLTISDEIVTEYGYHLYFNTASRSLTALETTEGVKRYIPTLEEIRDYVTGEKSVSNNVKTAITTYYTKYADVITGDYFYICQSYLQIKNLLNDVSYTTSGSFNASLMAKFIQLYIDYTFESNLTTITQDFLG